MSRSQEKRDALAAEIFPMKWARALKMTGKEGSNLRRRLRNVAEVEYFTRDLREAGHTCADCDAFRKYPHGKGKHVCDDESVGGTYTLAEADGLCENWRAHGKSFPGHAEKRLEEMGI